jgi:DNA-binding transcriptional LysR family regulator
MDMMQGIRSFAAVATMGSFTAAAKSLKVGTPQVSRAIADIEAHLGMRILNRTTRTVGLTVAGERYLAHCQAILARLELAEAEAAGLSAMPRGTLRIGIAPSFDRHHLVSLIASYQQRYEEVTVEATLACGSPRALLDEHDALLLCSPNPLEADGLASECLGALSNVLCASPVYLASHGIPKTLDDLRSHKCLQLTTLDEMDGRWLFEGSETIEEFQFSKTPFCSDLADTLIDAAIVGLGIGELPVSKALPGLRNGSLVRVMPRYRLAPQNVYVVFRSGLNIDAKLQTWIEYLKASLPNRLALDQAMFISFFQENKTIEIIDQ